MARVVIKKKLVDEVTRNIERETEILLNYFSKIEKKLNIVKEAYSSDNKSDERIDVMIATIERARQTYSELNQKFFNALQSSTEEYSNADLKTASKINSNDAVPLISGGIKGIVDAVSNIGKNNEPETNNTSGVSLATMGMPPIGSIIESCKSLDEETFERVKENIKEKLGITINNKSNVIAVASIDLPEGQTITSKFGLREEVIPEMQKEGTYNFEYLENGMVKVNRDGVPLSSFDRSNGINDFFNVYPIDFSDNLKDEHDQKVFYDGYYQKDSTQYESFRDQALYEAGQEKARIEIDNASRVGADTADNVSDYKRYYYGSEENNEKIKEIYNSQNQQAIDAFETAVRDTSVDAKKADDIIKFARSSYGNPDDYKNDN